MPPVYVAPGAVVRQSAVGPYVAVEAGATVEGSEVRNAVVFHQAAVRRSRLDGAVVGRRAVADGAEGSVLLGDDAAVGVALAARSPQADAD